MGLKKKSFFDDIFHLQTSAPEDVDPEDLQNGLQAKLVGTTEDPAEDVGPSRLRQKAAVICDDPKYKGRRTSRKDLYSDDEDDEDSDNGASSDIMDDEQESKSDPDSDEVTQDVLDSSGEEEDRESEEEGSEDDSAGSEDDFGQIKEENEEKEDATLMETDDTDDREKGKAVQGQLEVWDQIIKTHISAHKLLTLCNQLPPPTTWEKFNGGSETFAKEATNAQRCVRKVLSKLLEIQATSTSKVDEDDEEITSDEEEAGGKLLNLDALDDKEEMSDEEEKEEQVVEEEEKEEDEKNTKKHRTSYPAQKQ